ncbi:CPBP family intramembrane glutamic endopeptidase [Hoylesella shahii]
MPSQFLPNRVYQFMLMLLMSMPLGGVVMFVLGDYRDTLWGKTLLFVVLGVVFVGLVYWLNKRNGVELSGYYTCDLRYLWFTAGIVVVIETLIVIPFATLFPSPTEEVADVWLCIGAIFIGPVIEETMFRGVLLRGLLTRYSATTSVLCSSLLFGLIHVRLFQVVPAVVLGLLFSLVFLRTKSLLHCVLLHMVSNLLVLLSTYLGLRQYYAAVPMVMRCAIMLFALALVVLLAIRLLRKCLTYRV